ncbi:MAG: hypothetical protein JRN21_09825 [Nitrososphaerota archaeon]|nr:hypothetical protein [Nitrososphaerota archaeon]
MAESKKESIEKQLAELEANARAAVKARNFDEELRIDAQISELRKALTHELPRANRRLTSEDWKKIETEGPTAGRIAWGGFWEMRKSDSGPQRYHFTCSWSQSLQDAIAEFMGRTGSHGWYALIWRYEDTRGPLPRPYTMWTEHEKLKHFYICGVVDGTDGKLFKFPRLIDLYNAKDYALELLRKEGRL